MIARRDFLAATAAAPLCFGRPASVAAAGQAQPFPLSRVRLGDGPFREAIEANRAFLRGLEADRLLHMFRVTAGLPSSAEPLGGWERPDVELRGHFTGHYLSACALMYGATGDGELKARADGIVAELARCQKANGGGWLSAFPPAFIERLKDGKKVWAPWYTLHKIMAGLLDVHLLCGNGRALEVLKGMAAWTRTWTDGLPEDHMQRVLEVEFGGTNEVLYNLYGVTGDESYAALAHRFDHKRIFDPLAEERDELKGLHVNTTIPKIIGAARRYELTGEKRYRDIAEFFWRQVVTQRCYCTGGTSNHEHWRTPPGVLAAELSDRTQECCCTYNMLKLTRLLFGWRPEAAYADYYERALFNGILGTLNPEDGMTMYFVPLASGYWKLFGRPRHSFWCCTGTGAESFAKPADSIYFHDAAGLWVNLFLASELRWPEKGLILRQETRFPEQEGTALIFEDVKHPVKLALRIRVPYWASRGAAVKVNGKAQPAAKPGGYATITRVWKRGDRVEVSLPMNLHTHPMPDDANVQAIMYGPLVLAGELGSEGLTKETMYGDLKGGHFLSGKPAPAPEFAGVPKDLAAWVKPLPGRPLAFRAREVTLAPLSRIFGQRYAVYWKVQS